MNHQGQVLTPREVERIKVLLATTELTMPQIAKRMGCSHGPVTKINREFKIRDYAGRHWKWTVVSH